METRYKQHLGWRMVETAVRWDSAATDLLHQAAHFRICQWVLRSMLKIAALEHV